MGNIYFEYIQHIPLTILNIIISIVVLRVAYYRRNDIRGGKLFIALMVSIIMRAMIIIPSYANANLENIIFWQNIQWPLNAVMATIWFMFTLSYIRAIKISRLMVIVLSIVPICIAIAVALDHQLALIRLDYEFIVEHGLPRLDTTPGPLYILFTIYIYAVAVISMLIMLRYLLSSPGRYRQQIIAALITFILVLTAFLIQSDGDIHPALSVQIILFIVQFIIILGVLRNGFLQFPASSRPLLMLAMVDAFILFDHYNRISDLNNPAEAILGQSKSELVGKQIHDILAKMPLVLPLVEQNTDDTTIDLHHDLDGQEAYFQVSVFQIQDRGAVSRCMVWRDVTAQKNAEESRIQNLANQARIEALTQFVETASHDLKHPLTNIGVKLYLLEKTLSNEKQLTHLEGIQKQTNKLQHILDDMFLLMRLETNRDVYIETMSLSDVLVSIQSKYQSLFEAQNISLMIDSSHLIFDGDYVLLTNALSKLMDNALTYTEDGGAVSLTVHNDENQVLIKLRDNGIGIPEDLVERIAEPFYRVDAARSSSLGGLGLGLTLVKQIMLVHQGKLCVESKLNEGTTITLSFPSLALGIDKAPQKI